MHHCARHLLRIRQRALPVALGVLVAGCAFGGGQANLPAPSFLQKLLASTSAPEPEREVKKKPGCGSPAECRSALKSMVNDPTRGWVGQQLPAEEYTDGTRLFAYRALRKHLNCRELSLAVDEVRAVSKSLNGPMAGITPAQASRTRALNTQVEGELVKERATRCRA
jgi:hypothetical protein